MAISSNGITHTVVFELFSDIAPRACENFLALCTGFKSKSGEEISYANSEIHRIVPGMFIQGGRVKAPANEANIFEGEFEDETFHIKHNEIGLLGMCKRSGLKHSNESQFYITTGAPLSFMDNVNVVFGRVISGMHFIE